MLQEPDAISLYFKKNPQSFGVLQKLMKWDQRLSCRENAARVPFCSFFAAWRFAVKFGLEFKGTGRRELKKNNRTRGVEKLRKLGYTYQEIGRLHKVSRQRIAQILEGGKRK